MNEVFTALSVFANVKRLTGKKCFCEYFFALNLFRTFEHMFRVSYVSTLSNSDLHSEFYNNS